MPNDFAVTPGVHEPKRLLRAGEYIEKGLIERKGDGEYEIRSRKGSRYVNLNIDQPCDCEDCFYRGMRIRNRCKHTLAAEMMNGNTALLIAWGTTLVRKEQRKEDTRPTRRSRRMNTQE